MALSIRLQSLRARIGAWSPYRVDAALAAIVLVEGMAETLFADVGWGARVAALVLVGPLALGVALRRRAPLTALVLACVGIVASDLLNEKVANGAAGPFFALLFVLYSMASQTDGRRFAAGAICAEAAALLAIGLSPDTPSLGDFVFVSVVFVVAPLGAGQLLRSRIRLTDALRENAARSEREQANRAEEAVLSERTRIAGELHDVIAHALGAMTVQGAAARRLAESDPERAKLAFGAVETTGREALAELRRLLGVLRRDDEELALAPQPRLAFVGDLVRRIAAAGLPVQLHVDGAPEHALPAGVDLTAYRVVQEALGEALAAGDAGEAEVCVSYADGAVEVGIVDDGAASAERRLLGMRERVRVYGGELAVGPHAGGGHEVRARLPLERAR